MNAKILAREPLRTLGLSKILISSFMVLLDRSEAERIVFMEL